MKPCKRYFDHPVTLKKLKALVPGEVFVDTYTDDIIQDGQTISNKL